MMKLSKQTLLVIVALAVVSYFDNQYFYEPVAAMSVPPIERQLVHLAVLVLYMFAGYKLLAKQNLPWLRNLWMLVYSAVLIVLALIGAVQAKFHFFGVAFMLQISNMRILFATPLPLIVALFAAHQWKEA